MLMYLEKVTLDFKSNGTLCQNIAGSMLQLFKVRVNIEKQFPTDSGRRICVCQTTDTNAKLNAPGEGRHTSHSSRITAHTKAYPCSVAGTGQDPAMHTSGQENLIGLRLKSQTLQIEKILELAP